MLFSNDSIDAVLTLACSIHVHIPMPIIRTAALGFTSAIRSAYIKAKMRLTRVALYP